MGIAVVSTLLIKNIRNLYRGINDFKKGYQPRTNIVKGDFTADSHSILARWRNYFSQLLNVHEVDDDRQTEIHTAEPLVPEPSTFEVELAIERLKSHKPPGTDQIPAEMIKVEGKTILYEIHNLIISISNKEELPEERKESIRAIKQIVVIIGAYHFCQLRTKFCPTSFCQG